VILDDSGDKAFYQKKAIIENPLIKGFVPLINL